MKKSMYWMIWILALIVINIGAIPLALFSLFDTAEGTSIFSLDYLIAFSIIVLANLITIHLFISARKQDQKGFLSGLVIVIIEACSFVLFIYSMGAFSISAVLAAISVVGAVILLIKSARR
ncbi:hypothetical protein [Bacillus testis]|uniref:hypothetical protein n=1 Tax=Bacillus testis TaxID=1622072 RepID=UPI00067EC799|nr:hypothetical protein [Bacillus testis]